MSERGAAPLELALGVLVLLVPTVVLVLSVGPWLERHSFVRTAAAEAARFVVVSSGDETVAASRVASMAEGSGLDPGSVRITFCDGVPTPVTGQPASSCVETGLVRGGTVRVRVEADVEPLVLPFLRVGGLVTAYEHVEPVDPYRSFP